jgi:hypothetical protein
MGYRREMLDLDCESCGKRNWNHYTGSDYSECNDCGWQADWKYFVRPWDEECQVLANKISELETELEVMNRTCKNCDFVEKTWAYGEATYTCGPTQQVERHCNVCPRWKSNRKEVE